MMVDNLGWGEIGTYGGGILRGAKTPRLDSLAEEGMKLLNFNVEPQCTPSRSAFMTGRHPIRSGTTKVVWGMLYGLTQWEKTMAELFSDAGYATGMFGKWHLGNTPGRFPTDQGFDEWYGIPDSTDETLYPTSVHYDPSVDFWSFVVYNNQFRIPIKNDQGDAIIGSKKKNLKIESDGSVKVFLGPDAPKGYENNWVQTNKGEGFFMYFRLYGPTEAYYDKSWKLPDVKRIN